MQRYNQNRVYLRNNLPKNKECEIWSKYKKYTNIGTTEIVFYVENDQVSNCDSFGVEQTSKEIKKCMLIMRD